MKTFFTMMKTFYVFLGHIIWYVHEFYRDDELNYGYLINFIPLDNEKKMKTNYMSYGSGKNGF